MFKAPGLAALITSILSGGAGIAPGMGKNRERVRRLGTEVKVDRMGNGIPITILTRLPRPSRWPNGVSSCREIARRTTNPGTEARRVALAECRP